jgi:hypothetical protein
VRALARERERRLLLSDKVDQMTEIKHRKRKYEPPPFPSPKIPSISTSSNPKSAILHGTSSPVLTSKTFSLSVAGSRRSKSAARPEPEEEGEVLKRRRSTEGRW